MWNREKYFDRQTKLKDFGTLGQEKLKQAKVLMVGAGGLGCPCLLYLMGAGVGRIGIIDGDRISISNLHRQILYTAKDLGLYKAEVAQQRLLEMHPFSEVLAYPYTLTAENASELFKDYDFIIDGTDNFETRYLINDTCVAGNKPFLSAAIDAYDAQIAIYNVEGSASYRCVFPQPPIDCYSCAEDGVINVLPAVVGSLMATETWKFLADYTDNLVGKMLCYNLLSTQFQVLQLPPRQMDISVTKEQFPIIDHLTDYLDNKEAVSQDTLLLDIREEWEFEEYAIGGINIPLSELATRKAEFSAYKQVIIICSSGSRSYVAARLLAPYVETIWRYTLSG